MGRHHNQLGFFRPSRLQNYLDRVAFDQYASDRKTFKLWPERLVKVFLSFAFLGLSFLSLAFLSLFKDRSEQIPASELGAVPGHAGGMALRCHDVKHHDLRMEMVG